jgi:hypothetical protein
MNPEQPDKQSYEAVTCLACGGVHLVNSASGRTIDDVDRNYVNGDLRSISEFR